jgi:hypothetical protein
MGERDHYTTRRGTARRTVASPEQIALVLAAREHLWAALPRRTLAGPHLPPEVANAIHAALAAIQDWGARELDATMPTDPMGDT